MSPFLHAHTMREKEGHKHGLRFQAREESREAGCAHLLRQQKSLSITFEKVTKAQTGAGIGWEKGKVPAAEEQKTPAANKSK